VPPGLQSWLEDALIARTLADEVDQYIADLRHGSDPGRTLLHPPGGLRDPARAGRHRAATLPRPALRRSCVRTEQGHFKAAVRKDDDFWVFLTYDVSENRELSRRLVWG
jgi:hypothetical protein